MYVNTLTHLGKVSDGLVEDDDAASSSLSGTTSILSSPFIPHQSNDTQSIISTDSLSEKDPYEIGLGPPKLSRYSTADTHSKLPQKWADTILLIPSRWALLVVPQK